MLQTRMMGSICGAPYKAHTEALLKFLQIFLTNSSIQGLYILIINIISEIC